MKMASEPANVEKRIFVHLVCDRCGLSVGGHE